jgi:hypothetical protein
MHYCNRTHSVLLPVPSFVQVCNAQMPPGLCFLRNSVQTLSKFASTPLASNYSYLFRAEKWSSAKDASFCSYGQVATYNPNRRTPIMESSLYGVYSAILCHFIMPSSTSILDVTSTHRKCNPGSPQLLKLKFQAYVTRSQGDG